MSTRPFMKYIGEGYFLYHLYGKGTPANFVTSTGEYQGKFITFNFKPLKYFTAQWIVNEFENTYKEGGEKPNITPLDVQRTFEAKTFKSGGFMIPQQDGTAEFIEVNLQKGEL